MGSEDLQSPEGQQALEALGVASEEVAAEEEQAASALARALGHNQVADCAGKLQLEDTIVRKLGSWRKALRGEGPDDLAWCRALVLLQLHEGSHRFVSACFSMYHMAIATALHRRISSSKNHGFIKMISLAKSLDSSAVSNDLTPLSISRSLLK